MGEYADELIERGLYSFSRQQRRAQQPPRCKDCGAECVWGTSADGYWELRDPGEGFRQRGARHNCRMASDPDDFDDISRSEE